MNQSTDIYKDTGAIKSALSIADGNSVHNKGSILEAGLNYYKAMIFDPTSKKAAELYNNSTEEVRSGNAVWVARNNVEARREYLNILKDTASFFNAHYPFEIACDSDITQEGPVNFKNETADFSFQIGLRPMYAGFQYMNDLLMGLEETGKCKEWGFDGWSFYTIKPRDTAALVFGGKKSLEFKVRVGLKDQSGKILAQKDVVLKSNSIKYKSGDKNIPIPEVKQPLKITFRNVKVHNLSQNPIMFLLVDGQDTETVLQNGRLGIVGVAKEGLNGLQYKNNRTNITITGYTGTLEEVIIPSYIEWLPVTGIGIKAFHKLDKLTSVLLPASVETIGGLAFGQSGLKSITLSPGIKTIEALAFRGCQELESIEIPATVTYIGREAFSGCINLNTIIVQNLHPPRIDHLHSIGESAGIYVPASAVNAYKEADEWKKYADRIKPISELPKQ